MTQPAPIFPRPPTDASRRQLWREMPVRLWSVLTAVVVIVILGVGVTAALDTAADRLLLQQGVKVDARIDAISGASRNVNRGVAQQVSLSFILPGETERRELTKVMLAPSATGGTISTGGTMPIVVNPKNTREWTANIDPPSWLVVFATPLFLLPLALVLAGVTVLVRARVARLHASGTQTTAIVIDAHRSALIPGQKVAKVSLGPGTGVLTAAYPDALGPIARGDTLDVIVDDVAKPKRAIAARAYGVNDQVPMTSRESTTKNQ